MTDCNQSSEPIARVRRMCHVSLLRSQLLLESTCAAPRLSRRRTCEYFFYPGKRTRISQAQGSGLTRLLQRLTSQVECGLVMLRAICTYSVGHVSRVSPSSSRDSSDNVNATRETIRPYSPLYSLCCAFNTLGCGLMLVLPACHRLQQQTAPVLHHLIIHESREEYILLLSS